MRRAGCGRETVRPASSTTETVSAARGGATSGDPSPHPAAATDANAAAITTIAVRPLPCSLNKKPVLRALRKERVRTGNAAPGKPGSGTSPRSWTPLPSREGCIREALQIRGSMRERTEPVSWLEAALLAFPGSANGRSQWLDAETGLRPSGPVRGAIAPAGLLQWRGRAGFTPASEKPHSLFSCSSQASADCPHKQVVLGGAFTSRFRGVEQVRARFLRPIGSGCGGASYPKLHFFPSQP